VCSPSRSDEVESILEGCVSACRGWRTPKKLLSGHSGEPVQGRTVVGGDSASTTKTLKGRWTALVTVTAARKF